MPLSGSQAPGSPPDLALAASIMCNDFPTLWDRRAPIPVRLGQYAARRAHLARRSFRPFSTRAWTSAIVDRGNTCIRWPDRHGPVQRTTGPFPDVPVLVTSGDLDPNVPTAEGRQAARQFRHAQVVEVPNAGHVPELEAHRLCNIDHVRLHPQPPPRRHELPRQDPARPSRVTGSALQEVAPLALSEHSSCPDARMSSVASVCWMVAESVASRRGCRISR